MFGQSQSNYEFVELIIIIIGCGPAQSSQKVGLLLRTTWLARSAKEII
jgi:hypothetical protein